MYWQQGKNIPDFYLTERAWVVGVYAIEELQVQLRLLLPLILTLPLTEPLCSSRRGCWRWTGSTARTSSTKTNRHPYVHSLCRVNAIADIPNAGGSGRGRRGATAAYAPPGRLFLV